MLQEYQIQLAIQQIHFIVSQLKFKIFNTTNYNKIQHLIEIPKYPPRSNPFELQGLVSNYQL